MHNYSLISFLTANQNPLCLFKAVVSISISGLPYEFIGVFCIISFVSSPLSEPDSSLRAPAFTSNSSKQSSPLSAAYAGLWHWPSSWMTLPVLPLRRYVKITGHQITRLFTGVCIMHVSNFASLKYQSVWGHRETVVFTWTWLFSLLHGRHWGLQAIPHINESESDRKRDIMQAEKDMWRENESKREKCGKLLDWIIAYSAHNKVF